MNAARGLVIPLVHNYTLVYGAPQVRTLWVALVVVVLVVVAAVKIVMTLHCGGTNSVTGSGYKEYTSLYL